MDEHDMVGQNMVEQPEPQPQRKKIGIYTFKKKNKKQLNDVTFDEHGFAIGKDQSPFRLHVGAVTKARISILKDDRRKVHKMIKHSFGWKSRCCGMTRSLLLLRSSTTLWAHTSVCGM